jgi:hypothetical protein
MKSYMYSYVKWNKGQIYGFYMKSFTYVFNKKEQNDNWTLYTWLFT